MVSPTYQDETRVVEQRDRIFDALSSQPRRQLLVSLLEAQPAEFLDLPKVALARESAAEDHELRAALVHRHLPLLADYGFVRWETDPLRVQRGPEFDVLEPVVRTLAVRTETVPPLVVGDIKLEYDGERRTD
ncbi:hypothetical protein EL22_00925 [Halostagnicola sp. A56]|uniref:hypothetical protein n=1 Tax=Halostagnicola sp. A56 TaxID=1495067 RepID=UPI0004A1570F|nr:hypothetical protein [Halostagnicola sp. A56]KDE58983.1 hypothetical protein EL22_00925 [Halostagnicola sp. A56]